ncbi:MAG: hypothetical protein WCD75_16810 [Rhodoplanes sp.]
MAETWFFHMEDRNVVMLVCATGPGGMIGDAFHNVKPDESMLNLSYDEPRGRRCRPGRYRERRGEYRETLRAAAWRLSRSTAFASSGSFAMFAVICRVARDKHQIEGGMA